MHRVTVVPGDGIGPEIVAVTRELVDALDVGVAWHEVAGGESALAEFGTPMPEELLASVAETRVCLKGPLTTPVGTGFRSINVSLRQHFDLYANLRPARLFPGLGGRYDQVDLVIVRENTEDLYCGVEFEQGKESTARLIEFVAENGAGRIRPDSGVSLKYNSISASERIVRFAFEYARAQKRRKVTLVHKANILKFSDGLFLEVGRRVSGDYPDIEFEDRIVDNMCMQLVMKPELYDVLVLPNLYGDIISDLAAGLIGGLGLTAGANIGDRIALFEAVHGSAPRYRGQDKVNPTAMIMSAVMMLEHLGEPAAAGRLREAVAAVIAEGRFVTYDLKRDCPEKAVGTREMGAAIRARL